MVMVTDMAMDMVMARNVIQKAVQNVERRSRHHQGRRRKTCRNQVVISILVSVCILAVAGIFIYKEAESESYADISR